MNRYQRHSVTKVSVLCSMFLVAITGYSETSVAQSARISGNPESTVEVGDLYRFKPSVTGLKSSGRKFSISGKPNWLSFDKSTGQLKGRPGNSAVGRYRNISIRATDGRNSASLRAFSIEVVREGSSSNDRPDDSAPDDGPSDPGQGSGGGSGDARISGNPDSAVEVGDLYVFRPTVSGLRTGSLRFSISGKPNWLNFDRSTGQLRGSPGTSAVGVHENISIQARDGRDTATLSAFSVEVYAQGGAPSNNDPGSGSGGGNTAPTIAGTPPSAVLEGSQFDFTPSASDADGDRLSFAVENLPGWARFDRNNGRLWGTPSGQDVGVHGGIVITVSDGQSSASLRPFGITVDARGDGSITLRWTPPTRNTDGSRLRDLAAFRIDWGRAGGEFTNSVSVENPGLSSYVIDNLTPGRYMFSIVAVNSSGVASERSNVTRRTVN